MATEFLIPISFFAMVFGIVYLVVRRKERLAMIEKGADPSIFKKGSPSMESLKWGLLFVGIGTGILLGKLFAAYSCLGEEASMFSMICLLGGISLVIYHFVERSILKKESGKNE
jgi:hypothetical protein